jgi:6,7-dimethyl-8-ribityllumazine synthase
MPMALKSLIPARSRGHRRWPELRITLSAGPPAESAPAGGTWDLVEVPGALEVPTAIGIAARMSNFDGYVALGCVIRGETTHYDTVCNDSSRALTMLGLQGLCIGNGILTVENHEQAAVRAEAKGQNKGGGAAAAALHLIALSRKWGRASKGVGFTGEILLAREGQTNA